MRFYSPSLGAWVTRDPMGEDGGSNLYRFVDNNPLSKTDSFGLSPDEANMVAKALRKLAQQNGVDFQELARLLRQMTGRQEVFRDLGIEIHKFIQAKYEADRPLRGIYDTYIGGIVSLLGMSPAEGFSGLGRPDIFDRVSYEVYEIKSTRGLKDRIKEVAEYVAELKAAGICGAHQGGPDSATTGTYSGLSGLTVDWALASPGVIVYDFTGMPHVVPVPAPAPEARRQFIQLPNVSPEASRNATMTGVVLTALAILAMLASLATG